MSKHVKSGATAQRQNNHEDLKRKYATKNDAVLTVHEFAHRNGVTKGLLKFKERKETKRIETAKALRSYQKVMKQQGYEPGRGASRKRHNHSTEQQHNTAETVTRTDDDSRNHASRSKKPRTHRFTQAVERTKDRKQEKQDREKQREANAREKQTRLKERRQRHKRLTARTSKGQPVMKNMVQDILAKLQE